MDRILCGLRRWLRGESGQSLVLTAVLLGIVGIGFLGMAIDAGLLFRKQRAAQAAADAAAMAVATEIAANQSSQDQQSVANGVATLNSFNTSLAVNPATVSISTPASGNFSGSGYVQVTVSQPVQTVFMSGFFRSLKTITVGASAIAGGSATSSVCACLDGTSGDVLKMSNASKLIANNCAVVDDSASSNALTIVGSASLSALDLGTVSTSWDNSSNINNSGQITSSTKIFQGIPACSATMPAAPTYSNCVADPGSGYGGGSSYSVGPSSASGTVCYTSLTVGANGNAVTLNPGIYVITGNLHFESGANNKSNLGGNGVFFYLPGSASLTIDNGANVNLVAGGNTESSGSTAPDVGGGTYNGIIVYQPSSNTSAMSIAGGSNLYMNGGLAAPGAVITFDNGTGTTITTGIVASGAVMAGGGTVDLINNLTSGSLSTASPKVVQ
jgi:Flp pilus assembly protein TadG